MRLEPTWEELKAEYEFIWPCYYCNRELDPRFDYFCTMCQKQSCDNCNQACQAEECAEIMCSRCILEHMRIVHPESREW